jgi:hypothetical protein
VALVTDPTQVITKADFNSFSATNLIRLLFSSDPGRSRIGKTFNDDSNAAGNDITVYYLNHKYNKKSYCYQIDFVIHFSNVWKRLKERREKIFSLTVSLEQCIEIRNSEREKNLVSRHSADLFTFNEIKNEIKWLFSANDHLIEFHLIEIVFYHLIEIMLIT